MSFKPIQPLPSPLPFVFPYDDCLFPAGPIRDFIKDNSERFQCPSDFMAAATMVMLGSVLGKSHQIQPKQNDDWRVVPNLWGLVIAEPSQMKSPAISKALAAMKKAEASALKTFQQDFKNYKSMKCSYDLREQVAKKEARKHIENNDQKQADAIIQTLLASKPIMPVRPRFIVHDTTTEKLGELLSENTNGLLLFRDEFNGFLKSIDSIQNPNDRSFYLEAWSGDSSYSYDRIGRGSIHIENMTMSLIGSIQPSAYAAYVKKVNALGASNDGFAQRFQLAVYPDKLKSWTNIDRAPDALAAKGFEDILKDLVSRSDPNNPVILKFSTSAQPVFDNWLDDLQNQKIANPNEHPVLVAHLSKYRSLMPSIALILHLIENVTRTPVPPVSRDAAELACVWCKYLESHARRIYSIVTDSPIVTADLILKKIRSKKLNRAFSVRILQRKCWSGLTNNSELQAGLAVLVQHNYLKRHYNPTPAGRDSYTYKINPAILPAAKSGARTKP